MTITHRLNTLAALALAVHPFPGGQKSRLEVPCQEEEHLDLQLHPYPVEEVKNWVAFRQVVETACLAVVILPVQMRWVEMVEVGMASVLAACSVAGKALEAYSEAYSEACLVLPEALEMVEHRLGSQTVEGMVLLRDQVDHPSSDCSVVAWGLHLIVRRRRMMM
jgi:hypothetical protein